MLPNNIVSRAFALALPFTTLASPIYATAACSPGSFTFPELKGAELVGISADEVLNYSTYSIPPGTTNGDIYTVGFCNVTVTYTHPGWGDTINVDIWLPLDDWQGRLQALGGGGYSTGFGSRYLTRAVANGFAAIDTDGGHKLGAVTAESPEEWALTSVGNVNLHLLEDYAATALFDMTAIGKAITESYYGTPPQYSYFAGCSGGGRQALTIAQRLPDGYDGILAAAPAINIEDFIPAAYWGLHTMHQIGYYPAPCEINGFTQAAIDACDALDGVQDGVISAPQLCGFNAHSVVGQPTICNETSHLTEAGATVVEATWNGPQNSRGNAGWFGLTKDTSLTATYLTTECSSNGTCAPSTASLLEGWIKYFIAKDPDFDPANLTTDEFFWSLQESDRQYNSMLGAANPDLSAFRAAGGKMITWHGLADNAIPPNGTVAYYQQVLKMDPKIDEFYRFFEAPGVAHCMPGTGPSPNNAFDELMAWVEDGVVPETLVATGTDGSTRPLCPYPSRQIYVGGGAGINGTGFTCTPGTLPEDGKLLADEYLYYYPS